MSLSAQIINLDERRSGKFFGAACLAFMFCFIEIFIALKFNLHQYPQFDLFFFEMNWARLGLILSLIILLWQGWGGSIIAKLAVGLAVILAIGDAATNFTFGYENEFGEQVLFYPRLDIGQFSIRLIPVFSLVTIVTAFCAQGRSSDMPLLNRLAVVASLVMGIGGFFAVLPGISYASIGINLLEFGFFDLPDWNVKSWFGDEYQIFNRKFQIGPAVPSEIYYATMMTLAAFIAVAGMPINQDDKYAKVKIFSDWLFFLILAYCTFQYSVVGVEKMVYSNFDALIATIGCLSIIYLCWRVWGVALALCGAMALFYFFTSAYWPGFMEARFGGFRSAADNLWFNNSDGVLGSKLGILLNNVLPFILFGALLSASGAAESMIKLAFNLMKRTKGGPAHTAVLASGLFGTVSGSAVSNVAGTGVITIPMIIRRGFGRTFAGGIEATASTGGQIMPPIMGAAALVMADLTGVGYLNVMIAALIPALAYYASLFCTVLFESRKMNMSETNLDVPALVRQDWINVILMVFLPLSLIIIRLINGASPAGSAITAMFVVVIMSLFNPAVRKRPIILLEAIAEGGGTFARLLVVVGVVGIIVAVMGTTDLPGSLGREISSVANLFLIVTLFIAASVSLLLGMGMPTLPAYLTVIIILGPALGALGLSSLTAHMFVFYFGVASSITPPVALAAFAAAAIAKARPIATGIMAVRIGIVIFIVPFMFAYNPELMIVKEAYVDLDNSSFSWPLFVWALIRTIMIVYLLASATSRFDKYDLPVWESILRFALALALIAPYVAVSMPVFGLAIVFIIGHRTIFKRVTA